MSPSAPQSARPIAQLDVPAGQTDLRGFSVELRITNPTPQAVSILNPDMGVPSPEMNWPMSQEVYRAAMLVSFGYLTMTLTDSAGGVRPQEAVATWATPVLQPPLVLAPGQAVELAIPVGAFYRLESGQRYVLAVEYGEAGSRVAATGALVAP